MKEQRKLRLWEPRVKNLLAEGTAGLEALRWVPGVTDWQVQSHMESLFLDRKFLKLIRKLQLIPNRIAKKKKKFFRT